MTEIPPSPTTPAAEPEAPTPKSSPGGSGFAAWGWILLAVLVGVGIWFLMRG